MPETTDYMLMGYIAAAVIMVITVGSIWWRYHSLKRDEALIEQLEQEENEMLPATPKTEVSAEKTPPATSDTTLDKVTTA